VWHTADVSARYPRFLGDGYVALSPLRGGGSGEDEQLTAVIICRPETNNGLVLVSGRQKIQERPRAGLQTTEDPSTASCWSPDHRRSKNGLVLISRRQKIQQQPRAGIQMTEDPSTASCWFPDDGRSNSGLVLVSGRQKIHQRPRAGLQTTEDPRTASC